MIPHELLRMQRLIAETRASGVVFVSGDRHMSGFYRLPRGQGAAPYDLFEVTSSSLTHSFRLPEGTSSEVDPFRVGSAFHENNFGTIAIDWPRRRLSLRLLATDDCGLSAQQWHRPCQAHDGEAGRLLGEYSISFDQLQA